MPENRMSRRQEMQRPTRRRLLRALGRRIHESVHGPRRTAGRQGYNDREDESLGMRRGPERNYSQSMKDRRDESYGRFGTRDARRRRGGR